MDGLTPEIIRAYLPTLNSKLLQETLVAGQAAVMGNQLNGGQTPARYTALVVDLNQSSAGMAPRVIADHRDRGAVLPRREELIIIQILGE